MTEALFLFSARNFDEKGECFFMNAGERKTAVITGAAGGIGRALAAGYAGEGFAVALIDKDEDGLRETGNMVEAAGGNVYVRKVDLTDPDQIAAGFRDIRDVCGRVDVLINNAGLGAWKSPYELSVEEWDYVIHTNLRGTFLCSREAAAVMRAQGGGAIVNIASTRAFMSEPNSEAYAASKGGIVALTHALAVSLGPDGITVNCISPGWIETGDYGKLRPEDHAQHPAGRVGKPDDIVRACLYLTDSRNRFVTGTNITVDGGMTRKMIYLE
ncbi:3-ketoacyl-ACP reductase [Paenibacillus sp. 32O-W]|nr:3-ketoacyl-ACP reductase [Paenibacillus sp. 32O-W]